MCDTLRQSCESFSVYKRFSRINDSIKNAMIKLVLMAVFFTFYLRDPIIRESVYPLSTSVLFTHKNEIRLIVNARTVKQSI